MEPSNSALLKVISLDRWQYSLSLLGMSLVAWHDVGEAMGGLKQEHRDVLVLRLVEGCSVNETAALLGKTEGAVKVMQMRALRALRARLDT